MVDIVTKGDEPVSQPRKVVQTMVTARRIVDRNLGSGSQQTRDSDIEVVHEYGWKTII
jgi:hypothetical protein